MEQIEFSDGFISSANMGFVAVIDAPQSKKALLEAIGVQLRFPEYYGATWDSLEECLRDLEWIDETEVVLKHCDMAQLQEADLKVYMEILVDVSNHWQSDGAHRFRAVFSEADREKVTSLLG